MSIQTNGNTLIVAGDFNKEALQRACAAMFSLRKQGYKSIVLDMTLLLRGFAPEILPFAAYCRELLVSGIDVFLELPNDQPLARLFKNSNWAYLIDPRQFEESRFVSSKHIPAVLFKDADSHFNAVDQVVDKLLSTLEGFSRDQLAALEWAVNEITDNVLNHANSSIGGIVQLTTKSQSNIVEFVVCDAGVGIPKSLRETHPYLNSDVHALDQAIREGVTRNRATNMGNGLFGSFRLAELSSGYFSICSGYAHLSFSKKAGLRVAKQSIPYGGTAIICGIGTANPNILSEALSFRGQKHVPAHTYVDRLVEGSNPTIVLSRETKSFGSRQVAKPVRVKIETLLSATSEKIEIDLEDVALISSSFADEVFGKLFAQLGPMAFMARIQLTGGSGIVRQLIDRAIVQRAALGMGM